MIKSQQMLGRHGAAPAWYTGRVKLPSLDWIWEGHAAVTFWSCDYSLSWITAKFLGYGTSNLAGIMYSAGEGQVWTAFHTAWQCVATNEKWWYINRAPADVHWHLEACEKRSRHKCIDCKLENLMTPSALLWLHLKNAMWPALKEGVPTGWPWYPLSMMSSPQKEDFCKWQLETWRWPSEGVDTAPYCFVEWSSPDVHPCFLLSPHCLWILNVLASQLCDPKDHRLVTSCRGIRRDLDTARLMQNGCPVWFCHAMSMSVDSPGGLCLSIQVRLPNMNFLMHKICSASGNWFAEKFSTVLCPCNLQSNTHWGPVHAPSTGQLFLNQADLQLSPGSRSSRRDGAVIFSP